MKWTLMKLILKMEILWLKWIKQPKHLLNQRENNTERKRRYNIQKLQSWIKEKGEARALSKLPPPLLDQYTTSYILEMKKGINEEYEPTTVQSFCGSIVKYMVVTGYKYKLKDDIQFSHCREVKWSVLKRRIWNNMVKGTSPINQSLTPLDEEMCWENGEFGSTNPQTLRNTIWFQNTKMLGFQGGQESRQLLWGGNWAESRQSRWRISWIEWTRNKDQEGGGVSRKIICSQIVPQTLSNPNTAPYSCTRNIVMFGLLVGHPPHHPFYPGVNKHRPNETSAWLKKADMGGVYPLHN